jgi:hypothetical protein
MKRWQMMFPVALVGLSLAVGSLAPQPAHAQEGGARKTLYIFSTDFPSAEVMQVPPPPVQETKFWQLMDKEMQATNSLQLTESMEKADYRVDLRCGGIANCEKLVVDIKDPNRNVLSTFTLTGYKPYYRFFGPPNLEKVAHDLTARLAERLHDIDQGGFGTTD